MIISVVKERRLDERRVAASPDTVKRLVGQGHEVVVEQGAGAGSAYPDQAYAAVFCVGCAGLARCQAYGRGYPEEIGTYGAETQSERRRAATTTTTEGHLTMNLPNQTATPILGGV